jgi:short chain dehydrogenase
LELGRRVEWHYENEPALHIRPIYIWRYEQTNRKGTLILQVWHPVPFDIASCVLACALLLISTLEKRNQFVKDRQAGEAGSIMGSYFSKSWDPSTGLPDLSGKVVIVTGAKFVIDPDGSYWVLTRANSSGIGYTTAEELARHGAKVYVATRSEAKAHAAIEKIYANNKKVKAGKLIFLPLDLADLDSVAKAAEIFLKQEDRLDILGTFYELT